MLAKRDSTDRTVLLLHCSSVGIRTNTILRQNFRLGNRLVLLLWLGHGLGLRLLVMVRVWVRACSNIYIVRQLFSERRDSTSKFTVIGYKA